jgi:hypothetical protein
LSEKETGANMVCFCDTNALQLQQTIKGLQTAIPQSLLVGQVSSEHSSFEQQLGSVHSDSSEEIKILGSTGETVRNKM